jgi:hypothetical protein
LGQPGSTPSRPRCEELFRRSAAIRACSNPVPVSLFWTELRRDTVECPALSGCASRGTGPAGSRCTHSHGDPIRETGRQAESSPGPDPCRAFRRHAEPAPEDSPSSSDQTGIVASADQSMVPGSVSSAPTSAASTCLLAAAPTPRRHTTDYPSSPRCCATPAATAVSDEKAAMKLVFATLIRAADRWCRVSISDLERHQLGI